MYSSLYLKKFIVLLNYFFCHKSYTKKRQKNYYRAFFHQKIQTAWDYRKHLGYTENCRLVFGEADGLPALIIDKFNDL